MPMFLSYTWSVHCNGPHDETISEAPWGGREACSPSLLRLIHTSRFQRTVNDQHPAQHVSQIHQHEHESRAAFVVLRAKAISSVSSESLRPHAFLLLNYSPPLPSSSLCISRHAHQSSLGSMTSSVVTLWRRGFQSAGSCFRDVFPTFIADLEI